MTAFERLFTKCFNTFLASHIFAIVYCISGRNKQNHLSAERRVAEWFDHLAVVGKVADLIPTWKALTVHQAVNGYLTIVGEGLGDKSRGLGTAFHRL